MRSPGRFLAVLVLAAVAGATPAAAQSLLDKARGAMRDAAREIEGAAKDAGRSVEDFLVDNPDLNRDLADFGKRLGVPGFTGGKPDAGAHIAVVPDTVPEGGDLALTAVGLPGSTAVAIAIGPTAATAAEVARATSTERGQVDAVVDVPDAAKAGETLVVVVETADGRARLVSAPVKVGAPVTVTVVGTLSKEGVECPALRGDDGVLYTLTPRDLAGFAPGDRVKVTGTLPAMSMCMQGTTISVTSIGAP